MAGTVLDLGADWRLTDANGKIRPDARYNIRTDDGTYIYVQTEGLPPGPDGRTLLCVFSYLNSRNPCSQVQAWTI